MSKAGEGTEEESVEAGNLHGYKGLHRGNESGLKDNKRRFIAVRHADVGNEELRNEWLRRILEIGCGAGHSFSVSVGRRAERRRIF